jgi:hypothetical protein
MSMCYCYCGLLVHQMLAENIYLSSNVQPEKDAIHNTRQLGMAVSIIRDEKMPAIP